MKAIHRSTIALALAAPLALGAQQATWTPPTGEQITSMLTERLGPSIPYGVVVGFIAPSAPGDRHTSVTGYGITRKGGRAVDAHTVFEIGSVTKVFTTTILADMVVRGEVSLDDPVQKYLPAEVHVPSRNGKEITLLDLATQTSGLPRLPSNLRPKDLTNPYADYTVQQLYDFLSSYTLPRDPGALYEYSNLGMGLLGHALALRAGMSYEALVTKRVLEPLGMRETGITLTPAMQSRLAEGHDATGAAVANWDLPTLAGAGALRSTADDMLRFVAAVLDTTRGPLAKAFALAEQPRRGASPDGSMRIGLGWNVLTAFGEKFTWHNGQTGGYHAFVGVDHATGANVVVLASTNQSIDDIGLHVLDARFPLRPSKK